MSHTFDESLADLLAASGELQGACDLQMKQTQELITENASLRASYHKLMDDSDRLYANNVILLALLKEALVGCNQMAFRDWEARAEATIKEIEGEENHEPL